MARVIPTHLSTDGSATGAASYETASISPVANKLVLVAVSSVRVPGSAAPTVSGCNMTWTQVRTQLSEDGNRRVTVLRGVSASPTPGTLTIDFGGQGQLRCGWSINQFTNTDIGGTNGADAIVQSAGAKHANDDVARTNLIVTLGAFSNVDNATYGAIRTIFNAGPTVGSGFAELGLKANYGGNDSIQTEFKDTNDTSVDWTWPSTLSKASAIAIELKYKLQPVSGFFAIL